MRNIIQSHRLFIVILFMAMSLFVIIYEVNVFAKHRDYLAVCNKLRQIQTALNNYYDNNGEYPTSVVYNTYGEPIGGWRYSLVPYLIACNDVDLYELENVKWSEEKFTSCRDTFCIPSLSNKSNNDTIILGITMNNVFVCDDISYRKTATLITSFKSNISWGLEGDVEVNNEGIIIKNKPKPLYNKWYAVCFSDGTVIILDKSVPFEHLQIFFTKNNQLDPMVVLKPYILYTYSG